MNILGVSAYYHDSAACLLRDGEVLAAAQEERFSRVKHDSRFPARAVESVLRDAGLAGMREVDLLVFYDKPLVKFERLLESYLASAPLGLRSFLKAMPVWLGEKLHLRRAMRRLTGYEGRILFAGHHESHAASAFYPSPFDEAAVICFDGVGEWATTSYWVGRGNALQGLGEIRFPHSLGLLYSAFTFHAGFTVNSGEYKLMGLAPYGEPRFVETIYRHLIDLKEDGSFHLDMGYFDYCHGLRMTNGRFDRLFEGPPRRPEAPLTRREMDLAASIQVVTEEVMLRIGRHVHRQTGLKQLCLAGGVALNCVGNGRLLREGPFERLWIQPAAGDAGGALGAAYAAWHIYLGRPRTAPERGDRQRGSYLGPRFSDGEIRACLDEHGARYERLEDPELFGRVVELLEAGKVVGWFTGRMEFGPRALGARSILGDARNPGMQKHMNLKIKYRESFRPFAPAVLAEEAERWFALASDSPYMLLVAPVQPERRIPASDAERELSGLAKLDARRSTIPAVTHVDGSARVQTVHAETNVRYYSLLRRFFERTGCPVVINTSFNVRGEPIVHSPYDAYRCFMRTGMDALSIEQYLLVKERQPAWVERGERQHECTLD
jgi:carbamoyltransferase